MREWMIPVAGKGVRHDCLFVLPSFRSGGAERVVIRLLNALSASGFSVGLVVIDRNGDLRASVAEGIAVYDLGAGRTRRAPLRLIALIRALDPRVIFSSLTRVSLLLLLFRFALPAGVRIVVRQPSIASVEMRDLQPSWIYTLLMPRLLPTADAIVTQSNAMTADLLRILKRKPQLITMIHNPAPDTDWDALRKEESPFPEGKNFLSVGRISHEKGPDVLLRAFARVYGDMPAARMTFLGDGPLLDQMRQLAAELGLAERVNFRGYVPEPYRFYAHADVVVLASRREGFPNVLVEAVAAGVPVVATDCGGVSAEIVVEGRNGFVVPGDDPERLAGAMRAAMALRERQPLDSIAATALRFPPAEIFAAYRRVISRVASGVGEGG